jgi:hypothetical protein
MMQAIAGREIASRVLKKDDKTVLKHQGMGAHRHNVWQQEHAAGRVDRNAPQWATQVLTNALLFARFCLFV